MIDLRKTFWRMNEPSAAVSMPRYTHTGQEEKQLSTSKKHCGTLGRLRCRKHGSDRNTSNRITQPNCKNFAALEILTHLNNADTDAVVDVEVGLLGHTGHGGKGLHPLLGRRVRVPNLAQSTRD